MLNFQALEQFWYCNIIKDKIHNISLLYWWLVLLPNATLNIYNVLSVHKIESQSTWVALTHCTTLFKLFISCLLHQRKPLAVLWTNRQLWPSIVRVYHRVRMPGPRKDNNERGGEGLVQDPKDGSLLQMPPGPQSTGIHGARSGNFNLWRGWSTTPACRPFPPEEQPRKNYYRSLQSSPCLKLWWKECSRPGCCETFN